jgi:hypothetical protein
MTALNMQPHPLVWSEQGDCWNTRAESPGDARPRRPLEGNEHGAFLRRGQLLAQ